MLNEDPRGEERGPHDQSFLASPNEPPRQYRARQPLTDIDQPSRRQATLLSSASSARTLRVVQNLRILPMIPPPPQRRSDTNPRHRNEIPLAPPSAHVHKVIAHVHSPRTHVHSTVSHVHSTVSHVRHNETQVHKVVAQVPEPRAHVHSTAAHVQSTRAYVQSTRAHVQRIISHVPRLRTHVQKPEAHQSPPDPISRQPPHNETVGMNPTLRTSPKPQAEFASLSFAPFLPQHYHPPEVTTIDRIMLFGLCAEE
jgi:hypothetical protein